MSNSENDTRGRDKNGRSDIRPTTYSADELFQGEKEVLIDHDGETYRLRVTKTGKLILTK